MALLSKMGMNDKERRHELIYDFTGGRTSSSRDLYDSELRDLVWKLQNDFGYRSQVGVRLEMEKKKKRSVVLAIAQRCGIHEGTSFEKFNRFMLDRSRFKKRLSGHSLEELDELIKQFRGLERNYERSAANPGTKAYSHSRGFAGVSNN